jgi:hypothetical protein
MQIRLWWLLWCTLGGGGGLHLAGVSQKIGFVLCVWQQSGFNRREDVFTFTLVYQDFLILYFRCELQ